MKWFLYFLLGFSEFSVSCDHLKEVLNFFNNKNILILSLKIKDGIANIRIYTKNEAVFLEFLNSSFHDTYPARRRGFPQIIKKYKHRAGLIFGMLLFICAIYVSPFFIWQINITGIEKLNYNNVIALLEDAGVKIGIFSPKLERTEIYNKVLRESNDISWVSVNIQGSTANVEIVERDAEDASYISADGANIIASKDGQILDADIIKGRRIAKNGDVVSKGALLVSGVYDSVKMGTRIIYAKANVFAKVQDVFNVEIPLESNRKTYDEEFIAEMSIKIFGKSINIFKNYSKTDEKYDTIMREEKISVLGLDRLPILVKTVCAIPYTSEPTTLTTDEALDKARQEINVRISEANYTELISAEESYTVENAVLIYSYRVEAVQNIASVNEFNID